MVWRAILDTVQGPYLPDNYGPQIDSRRSVLLKNNIGSLADPAPIRAYIESRRAYLQGQVANNDVLDLCHHDQWRIRLHEWLGGW